MAGSFGKPSHFLGSLHLTRISRIVVISRLHSTWAMADLEELTKRLC